MQPERVLSGVVPACALAVLIAGGPAIACPNQADLNGDGFIDGSDAVMFECDYLSGNLRSDLNGDGVVNLIDFALFYQLFDQCAVGGCDFGFAHVAAPDGTPLTCSQSGNLLVPGAYCVTDFGLSTDVVTDDCWIVTGFETQYAAMTPPGLGVGAGVELGAEGFVGGVPDQPLGLIRAEVVTSGVNDLIELAPDHAALGATTYTLEVYDAGLPSYTESGRTGPAVRVPSILSWRKLTERAIPAGAVQDEFSTDPASSIEIVGGTTVVGDEIRIRPDNVFLSVGRIQIVTIMASGPERCEISGMGVIVCDDCDADLDGDRDGDGIDVGLFLNAYATRQPAGDWDDDGDWDGIDVGLFLQVYASCQ